MKTALFITTWSFYPPINGGQKRTKQMFDTLRTLGYDVVTVTDSMTWNVTDPTQTGIAALDADFGNVYALGQTKSYTRRELTTSGRLHKLYGLFHQEPPKGLMEKIMPSASAYFDRVAEQHPPDLIYATYMQSDRFIDHARYQSTRRVIDSVDLQSLNDKMWKALAPRFPEPPIDPMLVDEAILQETFLSDLALVPDKKEFEIYDQYDATIAIVEEEGRIIRENTHRTKIATVPMMHEVVELQNTYSGPACLPTGDNPYNLQGILYFARYVLPLILEKAPDFCLQITGACSKKILPRPGLLLSTNYVEFDEMYGNAAFLVCPIFSGTGQQVKITEAMAYGVPVVAHRAAARRSAVRAGETGLVADTPEEFADHVVRLWKDRDLCRRMGQNARELIAQDFSMSHLVKSLGELLS